MITLIQRVSKCCIFVENKINSSIDKGMLALVGISDDDNKKDIEFIANKIVNTRIFDDKEGNQMSVNQIGGQVMLVSQFTLQSSLKKGNRPSFSKAADRHKALEIYNNLLEIIKNKLGNEKVSSGVFGANMEVSLVNQGPYTVIIDSKK